MSGASMRAMIVEAPGDPSVLRACEWPVPIPGPGEVRLRVAYTGMNPIDALLRRERVPWLPVKYPLIPGVEHSGVVVELGEGVDRAWLGQRVLSRSGFGGYAEYSVARAEGLVPLPAGMPLKLGAAFRGCTATAWYALHAVAHLQPGENVLVHSAAGAVGNLAMQIARDAGARVCGLAGGPKKVAFAEAYLAASSGRVLDYLREEWVAEAREFAGARGYDVILDGNGGPVAARNYELAGVLGRVVYIGATSGSAAPAAPPALLIAKSFSTAGFELRSVEARLGRIADPVIEREVMAGRWRVPVSEVVPLAQVAALHARLEAREVMGRAVIEVAGEGAREDKAGRRG